MKLSCIIITKNRPDSLKRLLQSFESQSFKNFEIIIINDGGSNLKAGNNNTKVFQNKESVGSGRSRNLGVSHAAGEIILLLDDDVELVSPNFLEEGLKPFNDKTVGIVFPRKTDIIESVKEDLSFFRESLSGELHGCSLAEAEAKQALGEKIYGPMVCFVRREAFDQALGYDSIFGWGIGHSFREESDFQSRVQKLGWKAKLSTSIFFNHHIQKSGGHGTNQFKKIFWIAHNQVVFGARHEKLWPLKQILFTGIDLPRYAWGSGRMLTYPAGLLGLGAGLASSLIDFIKGKSAQR
jgi:glycosyltransferase involved in cell wall biosynthesis